MSYSVIPGRKEKVVIFIITSLITAAIGELFYDSLIPMILAPFLYRPAEKVYVSFMEKRRKQELRLGFRDMLYSLSSSFAGGRHMAEGLSDSRKELSRIYDQDSVILTELRKMEMELEEGETEIEVLDRFDKRSGIEDVKLFVEMYRTCRETGGDMIGALSNAADILGDKIKVEEDIKAMSKQKKEEGLMISVMPVVILIFLKLVSPEYVGILYGNLTGILVMTGAIALMVYSCRMISRITEISV